VAPAEKEVVDEGFRVLDETLGRARMKCAVLVEPTAEFFPDRWDGSVEAAEKLVWTRLRIHGRQSGRGATIILGRGR